MGSVTTRILVPFQGDGAGSGELSWAQLGIWQTMVRTGLSMNIGGTMRVPPATSVQEMQNLLRYLVSRHQSLRTRLEPVPDGPPRQVVSAAGEVALEVVELDPDDDAEAATAELYARYEAAPFDYAAEWPVRMGMVRQGGATTHLVIVYCHVAVDGFGIDAIVRDMAHLDRATGAATAPVSGLTPVEMVAKQQSPAGRRQSEKSLRYWEQLLRTIPAQRFGPLGDPREPRYWELTHRSPAMHLAMTAIAHRTGIGVGYILLAAYAVGLARRTGRSPSVAQLVVSNRFRPGFADSVSESAQLGLCAIDVADTTIDEVMTRAWNAATNTYMHGYYDPVGLTELLARVSADRGDVEIAVIVNDRRTQNGPPPLGPMPTVEQLDAARPLSTAWWQRKADALDAALNISVDAAPDAVDLSIYADTHRLGPAEIEALALEIERVCVEAAFDAHAPTGVGGTSIAPADPVPHLA